MKKSMLLTAIIVWCLVLAVSAVIAVIFISGGINIGSNAALLKEEEILLSEHTNINIEADSPDIELVSAAGSQLRVRQYGGAHTAKAELFTVEHSDSSLNISVRSLFMLFSLDFNLDERLVVEIPPGWQGDISVKTSSGTIRLTDAFNWQNISLTTASGDVLLNGELQATNLNLAVRSGIIRSREALTLAGNLSAENSSGDIRLDLPIKAQSITARVSSGNLVLGETAVQQFDLHSSSGDITVAALSGSGRAAVGSGNIKIHLTTLAGNADFSASSGDIRLSVDPALAFNFTGYCSSGEIYANFPLNKDERGHQAFASVGLNPTVTINAQTSSGNIRVE